MIALAPRTEFSVMSAMQATKSAPEYIKLMEIMFDMSATVHAIIAADSSKDMSNFMDAIEGSRGLFSSLVAWSEDFHVAFEAGDSQEDYIPRVDDFAREKFLAEYNGWRSKMFEESQRSNTNDANVLTVAIQIMPVLEHDGQVTVQFGGPDDKTSYWSVYRRLKDGTVVWELDAATQEHAEIIGAALGERYQVDHEPYPWIKETADVQA